MIGKNARAQYDREERGDLPAWAEFTQFKIVCGRCNGTHVKTYVNESDATVTFACQSPGCYLTQTVSRRLEE